MRPKGAPPLPIGTSPMFVDPQRCPQLWITQERPSGNQKPGKRQAGPGPPRAFAEGSTEPGQGRPEDGRIRPHPGGANGANWRLAPRPSSLCWSPAGVVVGARVSFCPLGD